MVWRVLPSGGAESIERDRGRLDALVSVYSVGLWVDWMNGGWRRRRGGVQAVKLLDKLQAHDRAHWHQQLPSRLG